jgi:hypothetical protein
LHRFDVDHHHGPIGDQDDKPYGNGVLLWVEVDDFEAATTRIDELKPEIVMPRLRNPDLNNWEVWVRDPLHCSHSQSRRLCRPAILKPGTHERMGLPKRIFG